MYCPIGRWLMKNLSRENSQEEHVRSRAFAPNALTRIYRCSVFVLASVTSKIILQSWKTQQQQSLRPPKTSKIRFTRSRRDKNSDLTVSHTLRWIQSIQKSDCGFIDRFMYFPFRACISSDSGTGSETDYEKQKKTKNKIKTYTYSFFRVVRLSGTSRFRYHYFIRFTRRRRGVSGSSPRIYLVFSGENHTICYHHFPRDTCSIL